jgi:hypothetical protein
MRFFITIPTVAFLLLVGAPALVWGQARSSGSSSSGGMFGSRTTGSGVSAGQRTMSGSGSQNGMGTGTGSMDSIGTAGQVSTGDRFLRSNRTGANDFVGSTAQEAKGAFIGDVQAGQNANGQGRNTGLGTSGLGNSMGNNAFRQGMNGMGMQSQTQVPVRSILRVEFDHPQHNTTQISATIARRLQGAPSLGKLGRFQVELQGRTAILRGEVASEHDRVLAEQMARLEPGVWQVQNDLVVAGSTQPAPPPAVVLPSLE